MLRYGRSSPGPYLGMEFLRMSRWRSAQKRRCGSRCYVQRGHGKVINQDGWYTFHVVNRYTFKCRLTTRNEHKTTKINPSRMWRPMAPSSFCIIRDSLKQPADRPAQPFLDLREGLLELQVHLVGRRADPGAVPFPVRRPLGLLLDCGLGPLSEVARHHLGNRRGGALRDLQVRDHGVI